MTPLPVLSRTEGHTTPLFCDSLKYKESREAMAAFTLSNCNPVMPVILVESSISFFFWMISYTSLVSF